MAERDLKIEIRQMIRDYIDIDNKAACSIVKALKMRHADLDVVIAMNITTSIIKEMQCAVSKCR